MYKYILQEAGQINWMALFALLTFFLLFVISAVLIFGRSKAYVQKMANLPLEDTYSENPEKTNHYA
ncbi:MAG: hypothetical protein AAGD05_14950 [Bacteroidota bacterium]